MREIYEVVCEIVAWVAVVSYILYSVGLI